jgi:hypothetical protein
LIISGKDYVLVKMNNNKAFTIVELSILITIMAIILSQSLVISSRFSEKYKIRETERRMQVIKRALASYYKKKEKLPLPADLEIGDFYAENKKDGDPRKAQNFYAPGAMLNHVNDALIEYPASSGVFYEKYEINNQYHTVKRSGNFLYGAVPIIELGLSKEYFSDAWGRRISYVLSEEFHDDGDVDPIMESSFFPNFANWIDSENVEESSNEVSKFNDKTRNLVTALDDEINPAQSTASSKPSINDFHKNGMDVVYFDGGDKVPYPVEVDAIHDKNYAIYIVERFRDVDPDIDRAIFGCKTASGNANECLHVLYSGSNFSWRHYTENLDFDLSSHSPALSRDNVETRVWVLSMSVWKNRRIFLNEDTSAKASCSGNVLNCSQAFLQKEELELGLYDTAGFYIGDIMEIIIMADNPENPSSGRENITKYLMMKWGAGDYEVKTSASKVFTVKDTASTANPTDSKEYFSLPFALISHGPNGHGGYDNHGKQIPISQSSNPKEFINSYEGFNATNGFDGDGPSHPFIYGDTRYYQDPAADPIVVTNDRKDALLRKGWTKDFDDIVRFYTTAELLKAAGIY